MYSLGIVAFEVAHAPWDTAMERVEHIQALRRAGDRPAAAASAPGVFAADADATVAALVVALVRQDPGERPGAYGVCCDRAKGCDCVICYARLANTID